MARHDQYQNDSVLVTGKQLHIPGFAGTNAQRLVYPTSNLNISDQWFETDTDDTYQWTGTAWQLLGGGGSVSTSPSSFTVASNSSLVVAGTYVLGSGTSVVLASGSRLALI